MIETLDPAREFRSIGIQEDNMSELTVGLLSPGEMGHVVGGVLVKNGVRVLTSLEGRSRRTKALAEKVGIEAAPSLEALVNEADLFLSILVPSEAQRTAALVADALKKTEAQLVYVDCNAIAPDTVRSIGNVIEQAGGRFVDAGIIGGLPPGSRDRPVSTLQGKTPNDSPS